jgi:hypothetical protein
MRIIFNLASLNINSGGSRVILEQMNFLRDAGFDVRIFYYGPEEKDVWENLLKGSYQECGLPEMGNNDIIIISEEFAWVAIQYLIHRNIKYIIFNQGISPSFASEMNYYNHKVAYDNSLAVIVNSEHTSRGVQKIFDVPKNKIVHYRLGIDSKLYYPETKEKTACFLTYKNVNFANFMKVYFQGKYPDWNLISITSLPREETAAIFRKSKLFLSFGGPDGFGLPPLEAALSGCKVIGFDGGGGKELFKSPVFTTVNHLDHLDFIDKLDKVIADIDYWITDDGEYIEYLREFYNLEKSKLGIVGFFTQIKNMFFRT